MFGSTILEVAIGIIFVYLLVSLIVTAANELIASLWKWRASTLERGIRNLLNDPEGTGLAKQFYDHSLSRGCTIRGRDLPIFPPAPLLLLCWTLLPKIGLAMLKHWLLSKLPSIRVQSIKM